jgi:hypothetical protein
VWLFGGGIVSASVAKALPEAAISVIGWDDISVTVRIHDVEVLVRALAKIDPVTAHPALPEDVVDGAQVRSLLATRGS